MNDMIRIQSSKTITVTKGLQHKDVSNPDAHIPDRLKVVAEWPRYTVQILEGVGNYPAEIKDWPSVKSLVKCGVFTISDSVVEPTQKEKEVKEKLEKAEAKEIKKEVVEEQKTSRRHTHLDEIAEGE